MCHPAGAFATDTLLSNILAGREFRPPELIVPRNSKIRRTGRAIAS